MAFGGMDAPATIDSHLSTGSFVRRFTCPQIRCHVTYFCNVTLVIDIVNMHELQDLTLTLTLILTLNLT